MLRAAAFAASSCLLIKRKCKELAAIMARAIANRVVEVVARRHEFYLEAEDVRALDSAIGTCCPLSHDGFSAHSQMRLHG